MRLILVRHGHTDDLKYNIAQGHRMTPLNRRGKIQAGKVGRALAKIKIDVIYSSDLTRAVETMQAIAKYHPTVMIQLDPALREKGHGMYEGRPFQVLERARMRHKQHGYRWRPRRGESFHDLFTRTKQWYRVFHRQHARGTIVVVSHGGFIRFLLTHIFHGPRYKVVPEYKHDNTGISVVEFRAGRPKLIKLNDTKHLHA
ncbi:MAG: histidine phosphatase family protein [Candidatus Kerfeldbacteria bacterium]|nr:histidine phosphatase family protein [Candidatus Kerfeldbacteria bacterium]